MLSLAGSGISGTLDESILQLRSLSHIDLSRNNLSYIPDFFQNFISLRVLKLADCHNLVSFPSSILHLPKLETLVLSGHHGLVLSLPSEAILTNSSIQYLDLSYVNILDGVLAVLSTIPRLSHLSLYGCGISGGIPLTWASNRIAEMDLSFNNLKGSIPEAFCLSHNLTILRLQSNFLSGIIPSCLFNVSSLEEMVLNNNLLSGIQSSIFNLPNLRVLRLNNNQLTGEITATTVNLPSLTELILYDNMLSGSFPTFLLNLPSLEELFLGNNKFNDSLPSFFNLRSNLRYLSLGKNCFSGVIPPSISTISALDTADFSSNNFNGTVDLFLFLRLEILNELDLSNNTQLTLLESSNSSYSHDDPLGSSGLMWLDLSSCNTKGYPQRFLQKLEFLLYLDLSNNGIGGKIPSWLWEIGNLETLILNYNKIEGFEEVVNRTSLRESYVKDVRAYSNHITGEIPAFICNFTGLRILDLSNNRLTSTIADCLGSIPSLSMMDLANNQLQGQIPRFVQAAFITVINLSNNLLSGKIDVEAFQNCTNLNILNLGNNRLEGPFPFWLSSFVKLEVLVLRYNHLYGPITLSGSGEAFPSLRIFDVSNNQFSGSLPHKLFKSLHAMAREPEVHDYPKGGYDGNLPLVLTYKGKTMSFPKVTEALTIIDLSDNMFTDKVPEEIGMLKSLVMLNISNNNLSGVIPKSLGNLQKMEALDLSRNHLSGVIPVELSTLSSLAVLNLSYNDLHGSIPQGHQFSTFDESSFEGNPGLCGTQVQRPCSSGIDDHGGRQLEGPKEEKQWEYGALGIGFAVGLTMITLLILLVERFSYWYWNIIDRLVEFPMQVFLCKAFKHSGHARH